jgi:DNA polymerase-3 subunit beta
MKIVCIQDELSRFLQIVVRAIATKTTLPILTGIYLEAKENTLKCVATDLEIAIEVNVPNIQIITPGTVVLSGKTFVEIIKHLPQIPVEIEFDESAKMVSITSRHSIYQIPVLPVEEFPTLPELKSGDKVEVNGEDLKEAIHQTIFATLADDPRPFLSSILWEITPEKIRLIATDVNRLAIKDIPVKSQVQKTALVPVRALREIASIFSGNNDTQVEVYISEKMIFIQKDGIKFSSRLVEAQFPRYEQVIPKDFTGTVIIDRNEFIEALERTALVSSSIRISLAGPEMVINAKEPDKGNCKEEIGIDFNGKEIEIGFNVKYLLDFLRSVREGKIIFKYVQELKPAMVQGQGSEDYFYIVMPLKLSA